jgi:hypothetical protein
MDELEKFSTAIRIVAERMGGKVLVTRKHAHLNVEITAPPIVDEHLQALISLIEAIEIATAHICPACGLEADVTCRTEHPYGEVTGLCTACGAERVVE